MNKDFWKGRRVLITGHTGLKGSWLALWLAKCGARVDGLSLSPITEQNLYSIARIKDAVRTSYIHDIRDVGTVTRDLKKLNPEIVFHLAAQPIVLESYETPLDTYTTNVIGTANVLDAIRQTESVKATVVITTDKVYKSKEWPWAYRETDELGGHDPYSASKVCAEYITESYRKAFSMNVATARAGNVIGGGDFGKHRLVPDIIRAIIAKTKPEIRNPLSVRPWQHVLECLHGYILLAEHLCGKEVIEGSWNFGPSQENSKTVGWLTSQLIGNYCDETASIRKHETNHLTIDSSKARKYLDWRPLWDATLAVTNTKLWYDNWLAGNDMRLITEAQISTYEEGLKPPNLDHNFSQTIYCQPYDYYRTRYTIIE